MKIMTIRNTLFSLLLLLPVYTLATGTPSPDGAALYYITPNDGDSVATTFMARFGLKDMGVAPAGADKANTGHHHLMIILSYIALLCDQNN